MGLTDQIYSPAYSTSVGLLYWAVLMSQTSAPSKRKASKKGGGENLFDLKTWLKRLLP
jgi:cell division protein FtsA